VGEVGVQTELSSWLLNCIDQDADRERRIQQRAREMYAAWQPNNPYSFDEQQADVRDEYLHAASVIVDREMPRVLVECDTKRRIIELHAADADGDCRTCVTPGTRANEFPEWWVPETVPCPTLRLMALPMADRDGYRGEWAPDGR
jgi:hypothetical protein